jgi:hydroxymethylbilane synthase
VRYPHLIMHIRLGTRGSALALHQAALAEAALAGLQYSCTITSITTSGDANQHTPLYEIGGKALFCKELDEALLNDTIDIAVHSLKDVPTILPNGISIAAVLERANPLDMLIGHTLESLPIGATVGTSSLRRGGQLLAVRPDICIAPIRGNVPTRLEKLAAKQYDALILAAAGLERLNLPCGQALPAHMSTPAAGQGVVALACRTDAPFLQALLSLNHIPTQQAIVAERAFLKAINGDCRTPVGAFAVLEDNAITLDVVLASFNGKQVYRFKDADSNPLTLGERLGEHCLANLPKDFLADIQCG